MSVCCRVVKPLVPVVRPKGLGLGADKSILLQTSNNKHQRRDNSAQEDELVLKRGSYCMLIGGKHDGQYGTVRYSVLLCICISVCHETDRLNCHNCVLYLSLYSLSCFNAKPC